MLNRPFRVFFISRACRGHRDSGFPCDAIRDSVFLRQIWGSLMGKPHPVELRRRVVDHVSEGNTHRSTAARFKVSVRFVNDMVKLKATTGGLAPKTQGNGGGHGKLSALRDWVARRIAGTRDLTAAGLAAEIATKHGTAVHRGTVWRLLRDLGLTHKKRPPRRRAEAARGGHGAPHLDHQAPALHGQPVDANRVY